MSGQAVVTASASGAEGQQEGLGRWRCGQREILVMCEAVASLSLLAVWAAKRTRLFWKGTGDGGALTVGRVEEHLMSFGSERTQRRQGG